MGFNSGFKGLTELLDNFFHLSRTYYATQLYACIPGRFQTL